MLLSYYVQCFPTSCSTDTSGGLYQQLSQDETLIQNPKHLMELLIMFIRMQHENECK